jgi:LacI family transcriptional regulator
MRHKTTKRIALLLGQDLGYSRRVLAGILNAAQERGANWIFHNAQPDQRILPALEKWRPHGIIAHLSDPTLALALRSLSVPVVSVTQTLPQSGIPTVDVDSEAVGRLAADYFLQKGFRSFAYYGSQQAIFSQQRAYGFRQQLASHNHVSAQLHADFLPQPPFSQNWAQEDRKTELWLKKLPKPVGILASNDIPGRALCRLCQQAGIQIPEEIAILGVDNDIAECRMSSPPLSSIDIPAEAIGRRASQLLNQMLCDQPLAERLWTLPPLGIIARDSTDRMASDNPLLHKALNYIETHATQGIGVAEVCQHVNQSRRNLERCFAKHLHSSIHRQIQQVQITRAKRLLIESELTISTIAERAGLDNLRKMDRIFTRLVGCQPSTYRKLG